MEVKLVHALVTWANSWSSPKPQARDMIILSLGVLVISLTGLAAQGGKG